MNFIELISAYSSSFWIGFSCGLVIYLIQRILESSTILKNSFFNKFSRLYISVRFFFLLKRANKYDYKIIKYYLNANNDMFDSLKNHPSSELANALQKRDHSEGDLRNLQKSLVANVVLNAPILISQKDHKYIFGYFTVCDFSLKKLTPSIYRAKLIETDENLNPINDSKEDK
ncbi:hypothetical protein AMD27_16955 (plasmid) [Acinetobacter sp. TGL-Y2]|uniref:hypothetical protein n=1 Tax=Acinetobacter sp. TGL-Y2 TaxID=1407071 RepID=UPI0007A661D8|nr:hypothetical protein [Acinetobacter sp. TGL-Y2]AMW80606.1 hypothetical protein AMD27_16955 [Acinetobacter sp. TGL-Y2]